MRSESTSALGQPRLTKPTLGLLRLTDFTLFRRWRDGRELYSKATRDLALQFESSWPIQGVNSESAVISAFLHCQIPSGEICDLAQLKRHSEASPAPQEPPPRSDKDFECVTGPPRWVK